MLCAVAFVLLGIGVSRPVLAADCVDGDSDGFQQADSPSGCDLGTLADCNDSNTLTFPGAPERCDNADNDCDGTVDDGPSGGDLGCLVSAGPSCPPVLPASPDPDPLVGVPSIAHCCISKGVCGAGGACLAVNGDPGKMTPPGEVLAPTWTLEGPQPFAKYQPTVCYDQVDNDCDGLTDAADNFDAPGGGPNDFCRLATDLFCNGVDDDFDGQVDEDFPAVGQPCSVGTGACKRSNAYVCNAAGDGVDCAATPGPPKPEALVNAGSCDDLIDNDCDGLTDVKDPACQQPETCDGRDNDGDDVIDNGFPGLGDPCTVGVGACATTGTLVCNSDKTSAPVCDVMPGIAKPEGPSGITCSDGVDNDCDGFPDGLDANCSAAALAVECSLKPVNGGANQCRARHEIDFSVQGAGSAAIVTAELLAMDGEGHILGALPVADGDIAWLRSDIHRKVRFRSRTKSHRVTAPLSVLRVRVEDSGVTAEAYCSPLPFVQVFEHEACCNSTGTAPGCCGFTSRSSSDTTPVTVAIPGIDPASLKLVIDGVDVFAAMLPAPGAFPGGPYAGAVTINGTSVQITDLFVRTTANTLTFNLQGLPCGGHLIIVQGTPLGSAVPEPRRHCYVDDYRDKCVASVFDVDITSPVDQQTDLPSPTRVTGEVCSGRGISSLKLNGLAQPTDAQTVAEGDGITSADTYTLNFDTLLPGTDLRRAVMTGETPPGSLDRGSNRLVADAADEFGNRVFDDVVFAVGPVAKPIELAGSFKRQAELVAGDLLDSLLADAAVKTCVGGSNEAAICSVNSECPGGSCSEVSIKNAFVLGLNAEALNTIIGAKCAEKGADLLTNMRNSFLNPKCGPGKDTPFFNGYPCGDPADLARCEGAGGVCSDLVCHAKNSPDADGKPCADADAQKACGNAEGECGRQCEPAPGSILDGGPCSSFGEIKACQDAFGSCPASIKTIETPWCTCNIPAVIRPTDVVPTDPAQMVSCSATLLDGRVRFTLSIPDLRLSIGVHGSCDGFACIDASIDYDGSIVLSGASVILDLPEEKLEGRAVTGRCGNGVVEPASPALEPNGIGLLDHGEFCDFKAPDGATGCPGDFPGGDSHCSVTSSTACDGDDDCPGGEICRPDQTCNSKCNTCTQPPHSSKPDPEITDDFISLGCGCVIVTIITFGLAILLLFVFPIVGVPLLAGAIALSVFTFSSFDVETIKPPTADQPDPIGIVDPGIDEVIEKFKVRVTTGVDQVIINPQGLTTALRGVFRALFPDGEIAEVPGAAVTEPSIPMPPLSLLSVPDAGNAYFVLSADTFNQLFAAVSAGPNYKSGFEQTTRKTCSVSGKECATNADCTGADGTCEEKPLRVDTFLPGFDCGPAGSSAPPLIRALRLVLCPPANTIQGNTPVIIHGRPEMPPQFLIDDNPKRCAINNSPCDVDDDCKRCSVKSEVHCTNDQGCPSGETCGLAVGDTCQAKPPTPEVEAHLRLNDLLLEMILDRNFNGLDGSYGSQPLCKVDKTTADCAIMRLCLDTSLHLKLKLGQCTNTETGLLQSEIQFEVESITATNGPAGEPCGTIDVVTPDQNLVDAGLNTRTIDVTKDNLETFTPPACVKGFDLAGIGSFQDPRLISIDTLPIDPAGKGDAQFGDYLGLTGDVK